MNPDTTPPPQDAVDQTVEALHRLADVDQLAEAIHRLATQTGLSTGAIRKMLTEAGYKGPNRTQRRAAAKAARRGGAR